MTSIIFEACKRIHRFHWLVPGATLRDAAEVLREEVKELNKCGSPEKKMQASEHVSEQAVRLAGPSTNQR